MIVDKSKNGWGLFTWRKPQKLVRLLTIPAESQTRPFSSRTLLPKPAWSLYCYQNDVQSWAIPTYLTTILKTILTKCALNTVLNFISFLPILATIVFTTISWTFVNYSLSDVLFFALYKFIYFPFNSILRPRKEFPQTDVSAIFPSSPLWSTQLQLVPG
jgi:hypothetical protein